MLSLRDVQKGFYAALFDLSEFRSAPVIRADGISPAQRLGFYRTNVFSNYTKALRLTYPVIERLIGSGFFKVLAEQYIRRYAHGAGDLGSYGDQFPEFLSHGPIGRELPYLADVARLEWAIDEVFNEADHPGLSQEHLVSLPLDRCEGLRFLLHPAVRLLSSAYPVRRIWEVNQPHYVEDDRVDLAQGGVNVLVRREGFEVILETLEAGDFAMLLALSTGNDFGTSYGYAEAAHSGFDPAGFLQNFVAKRVLADFTLPAEMI
jgi:hypothetical protein